jgi:hypothetical protein
MQREERFCFTIVEDWLAIAICLSKCLGGEWMQFRKWVEEKMENGVE